MIPEINLGPLTIQTFGLMFALSFVAAGWLIARRLRELDLPVDWSYELVLAGGVGGIIGAKLWFGVETGNMSLDQLLSGTGLTWYGGLAGGAIAVAAYARWRDFLGLLLLDVLAPALALGYAVGRVGCQLSGDGDYGKAWDGPWAMGYPDGTVPTPPGVTVHPTPVYETFSMLIVAWLLWRWRDRWPTGVLFGVYLMFAGAERFLVEFLRRNDAVALGLTTAQIVSLGMIAIGAAMWFTLRGSEPAAKPAR
ncbi:MAG: prolipoprotein diacylglyceryl transferase [Thermoleophilaceae bacterium]|nr:prolipoprotein diacylglyceryl transferase [Thermoleophilaceae bacterium]